MTLQKLKDLIDDLESLQPVQGDGNGEWLEPMTESEYAKWLHEKEHGWGAVYDKMLGRGSTDEVRLSQNENGDS